MKILFAIDGSAHSAAALEDVASRQWPPGTEVEVLTIVHSTMPLLLDPAFVIAAADATCAVDIIRAGRQAASVRP
jgi:hypothetical protein